MARVLDGVRVIDLGTFITGPMAGMMLADLGADVIKVERPGRGDPFREFGGSLYSPQFCAFNRGKRSITLNLASDEGKAVLWRLLESADVLIENFRPGVMERLGYGWETLHGRNERLLYCCLTGFGNDGPYRDRPSYDTVGQALSGILGVNLEMEDPRMGGITISDQVTGMTAAYGILGALFERERTGRGRRIDVNMLESSIAFIPDVFGYYTLQGIACERHTRVARSQAFALRCADGKAMVVHLSSLEKFWNALIVAMECPELADDPRFNSPTGLEREGRQRRVENYHALAEALAPIFATRPREEWLRRLGTHDVPCAAIHSVPEVLEDPQACHLGSFRTYEHPTEGPITCVERPVAYDGSRDAGIPPPPVVGQHTSEILREAGYSETEVQNLARIEAI